MKGELTGIRALALVAAAGLLAQPSAGQDTAPGWVARSNANAQPVLELIARFNPEAAGSVGVDGLDEEILDLKPGIYDRSRKASEGALADVRKALAAESDPKVRQDLGILVQMLEDNLHSSQLDRDNMLPYYNVSQTVFRGIRGLIDPQIPAERYPAAVVRLRKYAGLEPGFDPVTDLARARTEERFEVEGLTGPYRGEVEQDLERAETFITGLEELLAGAGIEGWQEPYATLAGQLRAYNEWLRDEMLPRAREDFRLPLVMYEDALKQWGVDASPETLIEQATQGYMDIRNEMMALAPLVAAEKGYETTDYRDVIRLLKKEQIPGDEILDFYRARLGELEEIIRRENLVSLPDREAGIRIGTAAETAAQPSPHLDIPRLIGNTGEYPDFVLPLLEKDADGNWRGSDDTYDAGSWTLTAHEARPGHELQFSSMLESGVSITRALFAFNSANVEGWALYAEAIAKPYMPLDGQLISLQFRLARAARMFLDPLLNLGQITPDEAKRLLTDDVVLGDRWAQNEIERYTYRIPGQATAYYYGYAKLQSLRAQTELALKDRFNQQAFHDFVLAQGLLPPQLLKSAVMEEFVPARAGVPGAGR